MLLPRAMKCWISLACGFVGCWLGLQLAGGRVHADDEVNPWVPIAQELLAELKPGYPGKTSGVTVDPANGDLYLVVPDQGIWKSSDHGKSFTRADSGQIGGRCESGSALDFDPAGQRLMCFMIYGGSALTSDAGKTWVPSKATHWAVGAVDWESTARALVALRHESGGTLSYSDDEGQNWTALDRGFTTIGIFDPQILVGAKGPGKGILRSTDAGQTWNQVAEIDPTSRTMRVYKGIGYLLSERGLLVSKDRGQTWAVHGTPVSAVYGPFFGASADHMVVVGKQGFHETTDGGKTWQLVVPLPPELHVGSVGPSFAWDPKANIFYASSMGKDAYRFERPAALP